MTEARVTQAAVYALVGADTGGTVQVTQAAVYALGAVPAEGVFVTQANVYALSGGDPMANVLVTQAAVYALVRAQPEDTRRLRAWTFSLDGHDFYVLRLGERGTLVCDLSTGQWSEWRDHDHNYWRAHLGQNWLGMAQTTYERGFGTEIVAGDSESGQLWVLDPLQGYDDEQDGGDPTAFPRVVTGGLPMKMRQTKPCGAVILTFSAGTPAITGAAFTLETSDDQGRSWTAHGTVSITLDDWTQEVSWRSLGLVRAPGRVFRITDDGAAVRLNGADMK